MPRDAIAEWRRALVRREPAYALFVRTQALGPPPSHAASAGGIVIKPFDLRKTRALGAAGHAGDRGDLSRAIRVLQRHNRLLRARFGMGWVDATNFVLAEAHRRGTSATVDGASAVAAAADGAGDVNERNGRGRIGPWRLLDLMQATMPWRSAIFGPAVLPEYGPPDVLAPAADPALELPGSNIGEDESRRAIERERARRVLRGVTGS